ncbi:MAG: type II toxin-antitoxin system RelE/ParE family toxin [Chthoniobacteraceae bacterium]
MRWAYSFDERALKELKKLGKPAQREILKYLDERIATDADPARFGKALRGDLAGLWRYRVGDYRLICSLRDGQMLVLVLKVGHRRDVYS